MFRMRRYLLAAALICVSGSGCMEEQAPKGMETTIGPVAEVREEVRRERGEALSTITVKSSAFDANEGIPIKFTCDGRNLSPALEWSGVPKGTASVLLLVEDPDAPKGIFTHWIFYNIPPDVTSLQEGVVAGQSVGEFAGSADLATGQGTNDFNDIGYSGPCPPEGQSHRYVFRVIALDEALELDSSARRGTVLQAIKGHVLAEGKLIGMYRRQKPE